MDLVISFSALVFLAPVFLLLALALLAISGPPVLFVQERVGLDGRPFKLLKFRTMRREASAGLPLTGTGDRRVTPLGRLLRASKLDELPQLVNVLWGEMSLVGPRPEVPRYVAHYTAEQWRVLEARPGLTDPASVRFLEEEALLGAIPEERREEFYLETVLPRKLQMNLEYIDRAGAGYDLALILQTAWIVLRVPRS
jgi:lipopolysaccharide/colanic/teichoic acid biosynthesis glycosyltransferase